MPLRPFQQLPFNLLPELPRVPHGWDQVHAHDTQLPDTPLGPFRMRHYVAGSGPPLVLVHGLMTGAWSWRYMIEKLGSSFTLWMPDLPGAGGSDCPDGTYRADALADVLATWMRANGLNGVPVIGNSLGGYVVMRMVLRHPGLVSRCVNLHSPGIPMPRLHLLRAALALPGSAALLGAMIVWSPERWVHRNVHYFDETLKSRQEARVWAEPLKNAAGRRAFWRWLRDAINPFDMRTFVSTLSRRRAVGEAFPCPLLLVYATADPMVPPEVGRALHALLPEADMVWLEQASHFAHVDNPDAFVNATLPWLQA
jgi:pimeloyl-ACP methyl ester carboxylesterase